MKKTIKTIINFKFRILLTILGAFVAPMVALAVVQSLNGQSGNTQTFANDTNVVISSASDVHSLGWNGILSVSRGGTGASSFTSGSVLFSNGTSIAQDNSNLFWDDTNNRLGISTAQPSTSLEIVGNASTTKIISSTDALLNTLTVGLGGGSVQSNVAVGQDALKYNTTGYNNTAVGREALRTNNSGEANTAVGSQALSYNTTGGQNTAMGFYASKFTTGGGNAAFGSYALYANTTGGNNAAVGLNSLQNNNGSGNTAVGNYSMISNTTGSDNIAIGNAAGQLQADGSGLTSPENSIYIGINARGLDNNDDNSLVIGDHAVGAGANTAVIGNSSVSDVYFGSSAGSAKLHAANIATVSSGTSAPSSAPTALGQVYIDTSAAKVYISTGTSSSTDWAIMN